MNAYEWKPFNAIEKKTYPTEYGKYLVCRKDGKHHFETWNNTGWAYNHGSIVYWAKIKNPIKNELNN